MANFKLTNSEQIKVLRECIELLSDNKYNCLGLCSLIAFTLNGMCGLSIGWKDVKKYIPLFTFENAVICCKLNDVKLPERINNNSHWWSFSNKDVEIRIMFLQWLINELEKVYFI